MSFSLRNLLSRQSPPTTAPNHPPPPEVDACLQSSGMNIALLGASGSGKGTHLAPLQHLTGGASMGAGDLLREQLQKETPLGLRARQYMESSELVPDELVQSMMEEWIAQHPAEKPLFFDGFPRTVVQARFLDRILRERGRFLDTAIYFQISDEAIATRLTGRLICSGCQRTFHESLSPPSTPGICDDCGQSLTRRADDIPELIAKRLRVFHRAIGPVLAYYHRSGRLRTVDADSPAKDLAQHLHLLAKSVGNLAQHTPSPAFLERYEADAGQAPRHDPASFPALEIVLMGGPGSGKGTQAKQLCENLNLPHIATGDLFRENLRQESDLGKLAKAYMDRGELVPDDITEAMLEERLQRPDTLSGFILDGFPRSLSQAEALTEMLDSMDRRLSGVIFIAVSDDAIIERLSGRLICRECQAPYHTSFNPPQTADTCDLCAGSLFQRDDDNPETVGARLKIFHAETEPLLEYYRKASLVHEIDGEGAPASIFTPILETALSLKGTTANLAAV
ncbi:MAG: adenylate kinase [Verrucomicrobiota bacterium]